MVPLKTVDGAAFFKCVTSVSPYIQMAAAAAGD